MRNLYFRLPALCQTNYDIGDVPEEGRQWDINTFIMADMIDVLNAIDWHFIAANSKHPPKPPKPYKRPAMKRKKMTSVVKQWPGKTIVDKG